MKNKFEIGQRVTVPSGMGGVWNCVITNIRPATQNIQQTIACRIDNTQYPDAHGQIVIHPASEVKHAK